ncbi:MAG: nucleotidyltransferase domain-containing protein [Nanoarchaeota archaeon]|nr:nucleotidyltransferase domain-containing protein [Nanoarchaeota archaeon]
MYKKLNITEMHIRIAALFTEYGREYHIREIARLLSISPRAAQLALKNLEDKAVIEYKIRGRTKLYSIKQTEAAENYLIMAEHYKAIAFSESHALIAEVIAKIKPHITGIGIIFGSYAKGIEKKSSDLDVFVAGRCNIPAIKKSGNVYGIDINVKQYPIGIFKKSIKSDILLQEVLKSHVIFLNSEQFVTSVLKYGLLTK